MKRESLQADMKYLFTCNFFDDSFDPEGKEEHQEFAEAVLAKYSREEISQWFFLHLTADCGTAEAVYNALQLYYYYCFDEFPVKNPYELVGYILARIDLNQYWEEYGDFVDSFVNSVLEKSGNLDLMKDPYYRCWEDPAVLRAVEKWKKYQQ